MSSKEQQFSDSESVSSHSSNIPYDGHTYILLFDYRYALLITLFLIDPDVNIQKSK